MNSSQSAHRYHSHGLDIESDLVLPEFPKSSSNAEPRIKIHQSLHGQWPELTPSPHSTPSLQLSPNDWRLTLEVQRLVRAIKKPPPKQGQSVLSSSQMNTWSDTACSWS